MEVDVFSDDKLSRSVDAALKPNSPVDYLDFVCTCLYTRLKYIHAPIGPMTMLLTFTASEYTVAKDHIEECMDRNPTEVEARTVIDILAKLLNCTDGEVITKCRLVSRACVQTDGPTRFIRGLRPRGVRPDPGAAPR
ncbi:hypothetical protein ColKHC_14263 [Colletotrichum higginsianum]|nr:hypothetical protein ColKHC_14263 [Colletotrichum higginsianum]